MSGVFEPPLPRGNERILLIDDEPILVELGEEVLNQLGYRVTAQTDSLLALEIFTSHPDQFDLVITDQTMPDLRGDELARRLLQIRSDIPIILCTGFSVVITEEKASDLGIRGFLLKPFSVERMARTVRGILDGCPRNQSSVLSP